MMADVVQLAWISAALPVVGAAVKVVPGLFTRTAESRLEARTHRHLALLEKLPEAVNKTPLEELINEELAAVRDFHVKRLHRELDTSVMVGAAAILIITTTIAVFGWAIDWPSHPGAEVGLRIVGSIAGLFGLGTILAGSTSMWKSTKETTPKS